MEAAPWLLENSSAMRSVSAITRLRQRPPACMRRLSQRRPPPASHFPSDHDLAEAAAFMPAQIRRHIPLHITRKETTMHTPERPICKFTGCTVPIRSDNKAGYCKAHKTKEARGEEYLPPGRATASAPAKKSGGRKSGNGAHDGQITRSGVNGSAVSLAGPGHSPGWHDRSDTLVQINGKISEMTMDRIWIALTPEQKAKVLFPS